MKINIITIFPQMFESWIKYGLIGQAVQKNTIEIEYVNPRDFTTDKHRTVDDRPFGGGDGMVLRYEPLSLSIEMLAREGRLGRLIYMSPQGQKLTPAKAASLSKAAGPITLLAGRYGGIDQRVIEKYVDEEISIGDYILTGGEIPAMALVDAVGRFVPGVLGNETSSADESFKDNLLEAPLFTRPAAVEGYPVPEVLLQGHHEKINHLRRQLSLVLTFQKRPDLMAGMTDEVQKAAAFLMDLKPEELNSCGLTLDYLRQVRGS